MTWTAMASAEDAATLWAATVNNHGAGRLAPFKMNDYGRKN